eukprot:TRINITY_DN20266_c0_g2_i1.p1 TRINITY_DN20266_c0_g2~~TRINITY_DN20266_c0_g2_i1.p1  ORF type:complete len:335 (+),score=57.77 TRINITY_DN20266_c0_g2_i1:224-1228(+)
MDGSGAKAAIPSAALNNGERLPLVGLGTSASGPLIPDHVVESAVSAALQAGYRHFDTAAIYRSERAIGNALRKAFASGLVSRSEVFITSKIWCHNLHPDSVLPAINNSLRELEMEYLDLYLIHWPVCVKQGTGYLDNYENFTLPLDMELCWKSMEKCVESGLTKCIGVSNFSIKKLDRLLASATIPPAVNQVEMHPMWQQKNLREYCNNKGIHVTAYSPLGIPGTPFSEKASVGFLDHPLVLSVASKHSKTPAQVALRWGIQEGVSVIPKSYNMKRIQENIDIFDFSLDEEDKAKLNSLEQRKVYKGQEFIDPKNGPYHTLYDLWDEEAFLTMT